MTEFSRAWQLRLVAMVTCLSLSCAGGLRMNIFPESRDVELGKQIDEEIRKNPGEYPILQDHPEIKLYVENVGRAVLASPEVLKKNTFGYQFEIIHDDSTINAFCTPGGYIYVYTGLLRFLDNEATLAGVLGHEIAHAERRHATERMSKALGVQLLLAVILGENPGQAARIAGNLFGGLALLKNSRDDELEADAYSMRYLRSTEYYPGAIRFFFEKVSRGGKGSALERLLSTHPMPQERLENVSKRMKEWEIPEPTEENLFAARYAMLKKNLPGGQ